MNSTLYGGVSACPGTTYHFECVIEVSYRLVWMSAEYIGQEQDGYGLTILSNYSRDIPMTSRKNANTIASLQQAAVENGTFQLVSSLHIMVLESIRHENHTVTCFNPATGMKKNITFQMAGMWLS